MITLCFLNSPTFHPLWNSRSLVSQILPKTLTSHLDCKNFLKESLIILCLFSKKKTKTRTPTQSYRLPKTPHCKKGSWDLCLTNFPPTSIYNDKWWKWNLHFASNDGWNGTKVSLLNWMQVMPCGNVVVWFFVLAYCWMFIGYYYFWYSKIWCLCLKVYGLGCKA